jgi:hypothetical protein
MSTTWNLSGKIIGSNTVTLKMMMNFLLSIVFGYKYEFKNRLVIQVLIKI